jgi:hypothetical protein
VNFHGGKRPDGFPVGQKFSIITNDPNAGIIQQFLPLTIRFVNPSTPQVEGYIDGRDAEFQPINTVANVQGELDEHYAKMAIEIPKKGTPEDDKPHPKVGAVAVKHGQLLGLTAVLRWRQTEKRVGNTQNFALPRLWAAAPSMVRPSTQHWSLALIATTQRCRAWID